MKFCVYALILTYPDGRELLCFNYGENERNYREQYAVYKDKEDAIEAMNEYKKMYPGMQYKVVLCNIKEA